MKIIELFQIINKDEVLEPKGLLQRLKREKEETEAKNKKKKLLHKPRPF